MENPDGDRFIPGIFNYCDRWCERCAFTHRCRVYSQEQRFMERDILRGNDPGTIESALRSVNESFAQAMQMLQTMAEDQGVDLNAVPSARAEQWDGKDHPLLHQAEAWGGRLEAFVMRIHSELAEAGDQIGARFLEEHSGVDDEGDLDRAGKEAEEEIARFKDALEVLQQYRFLIPVKIARATSWLLEEEQDPRVREIDLHDAGGTTRLVCLCLERVIGSLWVAAEFHRPWLEEALSLAAGAQALTKALDAAFPGHRTFVRPGFDELPEGA